MLNRLLVYFIHNLLVYLSTFLLLICIYELYFTIVQFYLFTSSCTKIFSKKGFADVIDTYEYKTDNHLFSSRFNKYAYFKDLPKNDDLANTFGETH